MEFAITNVSENDLTIELVDMPVGMFELRLPEKIKAGKTEKGRLQIQENFVSEEFEKSITIQLDDPSKSRYTIPVKRVIRIPGESPQTSSTKP
jgi:hypothetical protein